MGKKGNWFSAIKKVFTHDSKDTRVAESEKRSTKDKKKAFGKRNSFIPLFREPSSIEKILGDAEREHNIIFRPPSSLLDEPIPPTIVTPRVASFDVVHQPNNEITYAQDKPTSSLSPNDSATKIQSAYRGYTARRSFRALRSLVRLQGVVRGQSVVRQTKNAMKHMQLLVRVQSQIQTRRIQMVENQALYKLDKEAELDNQGEWDDSLLTKEQIDEKIQRKIDATIKRERALSYAYSHQGKDTSKGAQKTLADMKTSGFPRWWNWLEDQTPQANITPERQSIKPKASPKPQSSNYKPYPPLDLDSFDANTPNSTKSLFTPVWNQSQTQTPKGQLPNSQIPRLAKTAKPRPTTSQSTYDNTSLKDDASLTSCPPFSVPNYMTPTVSAKGKVRYNNTTAPINNPTKIESKRRFSLPSTQGGFGSFKWSKGSLFSSKDGKSSRKVSKVNYAESIDNRSVDSTVSLPVGAGRKPFKSMCTGVADSTTLYYLPPHFPHWCRVR